MEVLFIGVVVVNKLDKYFIAFLVCDQHLISILDPFLVLTRLH